MVGQVLGIDVYPVLFINIPLMIRRGVNSLLIKFANETKLGDVANMLKDGEVTGRHPREAGGEY